jgi:hypothetical protein
MITFLDGVSKYSLSCSDVRTSFWPTLSFGCSYTLISVKPTDMGIGGISHVDSVEAELDLLRQHLRGESLAHLLDWISESRERRGSSGKGVRCSHWVIAETLGRTERRLCRSSGAEGLRVGRSRGFLCLTTLDSFPSPPRQISP